MMTHQLNFAVSYSSYSCLESGLSDYRQQNRELPPPSESIQHTRFHWLAPTVATAAATMNNTPPVSALTAATTEANAAASAASAASAAAPLLPPMQQQLPLLLLPLQLPCRPRRCQSASW
jgi:hypothetical protein